jgi:epoxyqueuosine reductase QueG
MDKQVFEAALKDYIETSPGNCVAQELALKPELAGMKIFDEPLIGYAAASDPYFAELKKPGVIGAHFLGPAEWLPLSTDVVSVFLPFTEQVKSANRQNMDWPADEWLHARIEGQSFQNELCRFVKALFEKEGCACVVPMIDGRFASGNAAVTDRTAQEFYTSNWSERHAAYACGLGTFGLSKGLITRRGIAGRFTSFITGAHFEADKRPYTGIYDYCIRCGACVRNCPAKAISLERGKSHPVCSLFLDSTMAKHKPRYGCGKCQVKVPCESGIPAAIS